MLIGNAAIGMARMIESRFPSALATSGTNYRVVADKYDGRVVFTVSLGDLAVARAYARITEREWKVSIHHTHELTKWLDTIYKSDGTGQASRTHHKAAGKFNADDDTETQYAKLERAWLRGIFNADILNQFQREYLQASTKRAMYLCQYDAAAALFPAEKWVQFSVSEHKYTRRNSGFHIIVNFHPSQRNTWYDREKLTPQVDEPGTYMVGKISVASVEIPSRTVTMEFAAHSPCLVPGDIIVSTALMRTSYTELRIFMAQVHAIYNEIADAVQPFMQSA
jgi:hypothetical protein